MAQVSCPECGAVRVVGDRHANRIRSGESTGICQPCRYPVRVTSSRADRYLRYWLRRYGVTIDAGDDARQWVVDHGLPPALHRLACLYDAACDGSRTAPDHSRPARKNRMRAPSELADNTYEEAA